MNPVVLAVLTILFFAAVLLNRAYRTLPLVELRRRARTGHDKRAAAIYKAAAYGEGLELLLWLVGSISAAFLILAAANLGWLWASLMILAIGFFIFAGSSSKRTDGWQWRFAAVVAPVAAALLSLLQPVFAWAGGLLKARRPARRPISLYEKEDLLELLKSQKHQPGNRFSDVELTVVGNALTFGDKLVSQSMTPRSKLKLVAATETIGPMLMDELHKTGQTRFLVVKEITKAASLEIVGTLHIKDLLEHLEQKGNVRDIMHDHPGYINEAQTLSQALDAFLKTHQHLLAVVNNFEEVSGALGIEQVIERILGRKITSEFDHYDNLSAVAGINKQDNP